MCLLTISEKTNSIAQFITVFILFLVVVAITWATTHWIANYQKVQNTEASNIKLIEAQRLGNGKYIQIAKIGEKYVAMAVCKDTVTVLCEIPEDQIVISEDKADLTTNFKDMFAKVLENKNKTNSDETQDSKEK